jgi:hypothetical protein
LSIVSIVVVTLGRNFPWASSAGCAVVYIAMTAGNPIEPAISSDARRGTGSVGRSRFDPDVKIDSIATEQILRRMIKLQFDTPELPIHRPRPNTETFNGLRCRVELFGQTIDYVIVLAKFIADCAKDLPDATGSLFDSERSEPNLK